MQGTKSYARNQYKQRRESVERSTEDQVTIFSPTGRRRAAAEARDQVNTCLIEPEGRNLLADGPWVVATANWLPSTRLQLLFVYLCGHVVWYCEPEKCCYPLHPSLGWSVTLHATPNINTTIHLELTFDSCCPNSSSVCWSGDFSSTVDIIWSLIFPISVVTPVLTTIPRALPAATFVPWQK